MKKIVINTSEYPEDVNRIQQVLADRGYETSPAECESLWNMYSDSMCAGWMIVQGETDEHIFGCISGYIEN